MPVPKILILTGKTVTVDVPQQDTGTQTDEITYTCSNLLHSLFDNTISKFGEQDKKIV